MNTACDIDDLYVERVLIPNLPLGGKKYIRTTFEKLTKVPFDEWAQKLPEKITNPVLKAQIKLGCIILYLFGDKAPAFVTNLNKNKLDSIHYESLITNLGVMLANYNIEIADKDETNILIQFGLSDLLLNLSSKISISQLSTIIGKANILVDEVGISNLSRLSFNRAMEIIKAYDNANVVENLYGPYKSDEEINDNYITALTLNLTKKYGYSDIQRTEFLNSFKRFLKRRNNQDNLPKGDIISIPEKIFIDILEHSSNDNEISSKLLEAHDPNYTGAKIVMRRIPYWHPRNMFLGREDEYQCCWRIDSEYRDVPAAISYCCSNPNCGNIEVLLIKENQEVIPLATSFVWENDGAFCFDNIECQDNKNSAEFYKMYTKLIRATYLAASHKINQDYGYNLVTIGYQWVANKDNIIPGDEISNELFELIEVDRNLIKLLKLIVPQELKNFKINLESFVGTETEFSTQHTDISSFPDYDEYYDTYDKEPKCTLLYYYTDNVIMLASGNFQANGAKIPIGLFYTDARNKQKVVVDEREEEEIISNRFLSSFSSMLCNLIASAYNQTDDENQKQELYRHWKQFAICAIKPKVQNFDDSIEDLMEYADYLYNYADGRRDGDDLERDYNARITSEREAQYESNLDNIRYEMSEAVRNDKIYSYIGDHWEDFKSSFDDVLETETWFDYQLRLLYNSLNTEFRINKHGDIVTFHDSPDQLLLPFTYEPDKPIAPKIIKSREESNDDGIAPEIEEILEVSGLDEDTSYDAFVRVLNNHLIEMNILYYDNDSDLEFTRHAQYIMDETVPDIEDMEIDQDTEHEILSSLYEDITEPPDNSSKAITPLNSKNKINIDFIFKMIRETPRAKSSCIPYLLDNIEDVVFPQDQKIIDFFGDVFSELPYAEKKKLSTIIRKSQERITPDIFWKYFANNRSDFLNFASISECSKEELISYGLQTEYLKIGNNYSAETVTTIINFIKPFNLNIFSEEAEKLFGEKIHTIRDYISKYLIDIRKIVSISDDIVDMQAAATKLSYEDLTEEQLNIIINDKFKYVFESVYTSLKLQDTNLSDLIANVFSLVFSEIGIKQSDINQHPQLLETIKNKFVHLFKEFLENTVVKSFEYIYGRTREFIDRILSETNYINAPNESKLIRINNLIKTVKEPKSYFGGYSEIMNPLTESIHIIPQLIPEEVTEYYNIIINYLTKIKEQIVNEPVTASWFGFAKKSILISSAY
jgi:hypothetical protein